MPLLAFRSCFSPGVRRNGHAKSQAHEDLIAPAGLLHVRQFSGEERMANGEWLMAKSDALYRAKYSRPKMYSQSAPMKCQYHAVTSMMMRRVSGGLFSQLVTPA